MISYWVNAEHRGGIDRYLATRGRALAEQIQVRVYEELAPHLDVTLGAHIFSALDQLNDSGREAVAALYDRLAVRCPGAPRLNDPRQALLRHNLLNTLFDAGINRFAARRASERTDDLRFPVFVREENAHDGPLTGLLADRRALARASLALRARGHRGSGLLVVEFCDLSDDDGFYHKAAAFKVGDAIVPAHLLIGRPWVLKWDEAVRDERSLRENLEFVTGNPHEAWLRRVFDLAHVNYGRCDYGVSGDTLQVWEINLNATIGFGPGPPPAPLSPKLEALLDQARLAHHDMMRAAFRALDPGMGTDRVTLTLDAALISRVSADAARARRRSAVRRFLQGLFHHRTIGRPFRMLYSRFLPRP